MKASKYHKIRLLRAWNDTKTFLYKKTVTTFVTAIIIFCMTIANFTIGAKYYQLLKAIEVEFAGLLIMFVLLFFWKSLRTVPERIYEEQQEIINFQQENIESLEERQRQMQDVK
jgi:energy-coupling factor transporter transmembrane protein EcfT